jgi:hypothetical protein
VDAPAPRRLDRGAAAVDVGERGARQAGDHRVLGALGDLAHRLEIAVGGDGKARLDDVDAHFVEELGDFELFLERHRGAGALLAVAQRRVEDEDFVLVEFDGPGGCGLRGDDVGRGGHALHLEFLAARPALERPGRGGSFKDP